jgi:hypothetical protein
MLDSECMDGASPRKLRLFAVACCRRIWRHLADARSKEAVDRAEEYAEGKLDAERLRFSMSAAWDAYLTQDEAALHASRGAALVADAAPGFAAREAADAAIAATVCDPDDPEEDHVFQAIILRDIFYNPFRPVSITPDWLTPTETSLARAAYDERSLPSGELDLARLAVLSDALEEAGCDDADILNHLRSLGPHVRGCWVVDLLLGKE